MMLLDEIVTNQRLELGMAEEIHQIAIELGG